VDKCLLRREPRGPDLSSSRRERNTIAVTGVCYRSVIFKLTSKVAPPFVVQTDG